MTLHRRSPRPLSLALAPIQDSVAPQTLLAEVQRAWPEVVGEAFAANTTPVSERGGSVLVSCSAAVWAQELDLMSPTFLSGLNSRVTTGRVSRLRCVAEDR